MTTSTWILLSKKSVLLIGKFTHIYIYYYYSYQSLRKRTQARRAMEAREASKSHSPISTKRAKRPCYWEIHAQLELPELARTYVSWWEQWKLSKLPDQATLAWIASITTKKPWVGSAWVCGVSYGFHACTGSFHRWHSLPTIPGVSVTTQELMWLLFFRHPRWKLRLLSHILVSMNAGKLPRLHRVFPSLS